MVSSRGELFHGDETQISINFASAAVRPSHVPGAKDGLVMKMPGAKAGLHVVQ
jgi:hypothetical protein